MHGLDVVVCFGGVYVMAIICHRNTDAMKVLLVFAHPEPRSLNGALRDVAVAELEVQGHEVRLSDLYAEGFKPQVDRADFQAHARDARLMPVVASKKAFESNTLTSDVRGEIEKLLWADALILQFPLWWFSMPAILKGWVDRVFAYGVGEHSDKRWGDRYGEGSLAGEARNVDRDRWRLGAALRPPRGQRADRRPVVSDQSRDSLLSGL
jgi:putative NADPH-quinone reductase